MPEDIKVKRSIFPLRLTAEEKARWQAAAAEEGAENLTAFVVSVIEERIAGPTIVLDIDPETKARWERAAKERGMTLNAMITAAVEAALEPTSTLPARPPGGHSPPAARRRPTAAPPKPAAPAKRTHGKKAGTCPVGPTGVCEHRINLGAWCKVTGGMVA